VAAVGPIGFDGVAVNTVFHLVSLLFFGVLIWLALRAQRDRALILGLLLSQRRHASLSRVEVAAPSVFLRRFAAALNIAFVGDGPAGELPVRVNSALFTELFLQSGLSLIRCKSTMAGSSPGLLVELRTEDSVTALGMVERLSQALGGRVVVQLLPPEVRSSPEAFN